MDPDGYLAGGRRSRGEGKRGVESARRGKRRGESAVRWDTPAKEDRRTRTVAFGKR